MIGLLALCARAGIARPTDTGAVNPPQVGDSVGAPAMATDPAAAERVPLKKIFERPPPLPDGAYLTQVVGSLQASEGGRGWAFRFHDSFENEPDRVMRLLPSITLADMIRNRAQMKEGSIAKFELTGRVTLYRGENYVMPLFVTVISEFPPRQARPTLAPPGAWYGLVQSPDMAQVRKTEEFDQRRASLTLVRKAFLSLSSPLSPESIAAEQLQRQHALGGISADDIERELVSRVGDVQRSLDAPRLPALNPQATNEMKWLQPGRRVHDRLGTVMRDPVIGVWRFVFESSRGRVGEREAELLPCALMESLVKQAKSSGGLATGIISGEISFFEGRSYLFPTSFGALRTGKLLSR